MAYNKVKDRLTKRALRAKARSKGLCAVCCFRRPHQGKKTCSVCLARGHDRNRLITELMKAYRASNAA